MVARTSLRSAAAKAKAAITALESVDLEETSKERGVRVRKWGEPTSTTDEDAAAPTGQEIHEDKSTSSHASSRSGKWNLRAVPATIGSGKGDKGATARNGRFIEAAKTKAASAKAAAKKEAEARWQREQEVLAEARMAEAEARYRRIEDRETSEAKRLTRKRPRPSASVLSAALLQDIRRPTTCLAAKSAAKPPKPVPIRRSNAETLRLIREEFIKQEQDREWRNDADDKKGDKYRKKKSQERISR